MKFIKTGIGLLTRLEIAVITAALALAVVPKAKAGQQVADLGGTNNVPAASTNDYSMLSSSVFDLSKTTDATIGIGFNGYSTTDVLTRTFTFDATEDFNAIWMTNFLTLSLAANYTNTVGLVTNLPSGYRPTGLRLHYIQCPSGSTNYMTNVVVKVFTKNGV